MAADGREVAMRQDVDGVPTWPDDVAAEYRARGWWAGETFGQVLAARAAADPGHEAVVGGGDRWTYAELDARASTLAAGLAALGLGPGERVVVQLPNEAVFVEVLFACFRLGVVPILALPAHRRTELEYFASRSEAAAILVTGTRGRFDHASLATEVAAACPTVRAVIVDAPDDELDHGATALSAVRAKGELAARSGRPLPADPAPQDLALLQLSGGTTGLSKLIPRTHDDYLYSVRASAEICEQGRASRYLAVLPAGHNFPLSSAGILGTIASGGTVVLCPRPDPQTALDLIAAERITVTGVVPPLAIAWLEAVTAGTPADTSSLELLQVGGARLDGAVAARIGPTFGCRLQQVFGMAEGLVNYTRAGDTDDLVLETQGRPMSPGDEVRVVDEDDQDVPVGRTGALLTRGPYTIRGYWRAPDHDAASFTADGFYRTGDLVRRRTTGHLEVVGRVKEQINRGGEKVAPAEVEGHLLAHPAVVDACVVGLPDAALGERTCAVVVASDRGDVPTGAQLRRFVRERGVAAFKVPDRVAFVPAFPTTGVGKVSRQHLRTLLAERIAAGMPLDAPTQHSDRSDPSDHARSPT